MAAKTMVRHTIITKPTPTVDAVFLYYFRLSDTAHRLSGEVNRNRVDIDIKWIVPPKCPMLTMFDLSSIMHRKLVTLADITR